MTRQRTVLCLCRHQIFYLANNSEKKNGQQTLTFAQKVDAVPTHFDSHQHMKISNNLYFMQMKRNEMIFHNHWPPYIFTIFFLIVVVVAFVAAVDIAIFKCKITA